VEQVKPAEPVETRADLAVASRDVVRDAKTGEVCVTVHNVGSRGASQVTVRLTDASGKTVAETTVPSVPAPLDLRPKTVTVRLKAREKLTEGTYSVVVDPDDAVPEITERNNRVGLRGGR